jgi:hypothetical protein
MRTLAAKLCFYGFPTNRPRCVNTQECDVAADANTATSCETETREPKQRPKVASSLYIEAWRSLARLYDTLDTIK